MGWGALSPGRVDRGLTRPAIGSNALRTIGATLFALTCVLLVSCGGEPQLVPPADLSPAATTGAPTAPLSTPESAAETPQIGEITWAAAIDPATNAPLEPVSGFVPDAPRITASMPIHEVPAGSTIEATWAYNDTSLDAFTTQLVPTDTIEERWIAFHIDRGSGVPWPVGVYEVTISLNGAAMQQAAVEVTGQA